MPRITDAFIIWNLGASKKTIHGNGRKKAFFFSLQINLYVQDENMEKWEAVDEALRKTGKPYSFRDVMIDIDKDMMHYVFVVYLDGVHYGEQA